MCSVNDIDLEETVKCMEGKPNYKCRIGEICKKCNERRAEIVCRIRDSYCRECFLAAATHKFRATLGKSKLVKPNDHVLIAFSGSQSSIALLNLVKAGLSETTRKRLLFSCSITYIDEGVIIKLLPTERRDICNTVMKHLEKYDLPIYVTSLEKSLDNSKITFNDCDENSKHTIEKEKQLMQLMQSVESLTAREDLLQKLRDNLLLKIAKQLGCSKIFTADTSDHLAIKLLSNISLGRGAQLPLDIGFCDNRVPDMLLLRPMREFTRKDIAFYNTFNHLESISIPSLQTKAEPHESIQKLTEKFIVELQEDFPATVSTVFRTGDKLSMGTCFNDAIELCTLCQAPLDTTKKDSSALQATKFSQRVSTLGPERFYEDCIESVSTGDQNKGKVCQTQDNCKTGCGGGDCKENIDEIVFSEAQECFCYSCRLIIREMKSLQALPVDVVNKIKEHMMFKKMRTEIQDFLL